MKNPNKNCLEGMQCPKCKRYGPFRIAVSCVVTVRDNGTDDDGAPEWDSGSYCECPSCDHDGIVSDFKGAA